MLNNLKEALSKSLEEIYDCPIDSDFTCSFKGIETLSEMEYDKVYENFINVESSDFAVSFDLSHGRMEEDYLLLFVNDKPLVSYEEYYRYFTKNRMGQQVLKEISDKIVVPF